MTSSERLDLVMRFEGGEITPDEALDLFSNLVRTGLAWSLQGFYGRTAALLINTGYLDSAGKILRQLDENEKVVW